MFPSVRMPFDKQHSEKKKYRIRSMAEMIIHPVSRSCPFAFLCMYVYV